MLHDQRINYYHVHNEEYHEEDKSRRQLQRLKP